ncbi:hypothetical protein [Bradyrhizobium sp. 33ap4]|uniref:hypothetical protein n=1 Tax=Bradyrhizobium sp. 33ap4 TaxID=3061630 RepID=UPI00292F6DF5|nr:hypothetical protein [Bradyrhizobium sp. 33ap4]
MVETEVPSFKGDLTTAIEARRRRLRELQSDLQRTRCAPWPSPDRKQAMIAQVEALAEAGRPDVNGSVAYAEDVRWPLATHRVDVHNSAPGAVGFVQMPDTLIELAKSQGLPAEYRDTTDPLAMLSIKWVAAPLPAPRAAPVKPVSCAELAPDTSGCAAGSHRHGGAAPGGVGFLCTHPPGAPQALIWDRDGRAR